MVNRQHWAPILYRWWLVALGVCAGLAVTSVYLYARPSQFHASAFVRVELILSAKSLPTTQPATLNALNTQVTQATSDTVLQSVTRRIPGMNVHQLRASLKVTPVVSSQLLEIDAAAESANMAATIANADAQALIERQTASDESDNHLREQPLVQQIATAQSQADAISKELAALQTNAGATDPDVLSAQLRTAKVRLTTATDTVTKTRKALIQLQSDEAEHATYLSVLQPAASSSTRQTPDPIRILGLGGGSGLALGLCLAVLLGPPNRKARTVAEVARALGASSVVSLRPSDHVRRYIDVATNESIEGFRSLWVRLATTGASELGKVLLVTAERNHSGASLFAADLGRQWATEGKPVLIVDVNWDHPSIGSRLAAAPSEGLAHAITQMMTEPVDIGDYIVPTHASRLWALPAGEFAEPLDSATVMLYLARALDQLRLMNFAVVIINGSPITSDGLMALLAERADGVVVVARKADARQRNLQRIQAALRPSLAPTLALIVNESNGPASSAGGSNRRRKR